MNFELKTELLGFCEQSWRVNAVTDKYTILIFETTSFAAIKMICRPLCMYSNTLILVRDPRSVVYLIWNLILIIRFQASVCFISDELRIQVDFIAQGSQDQSRKHDSSASE